MELAHPIDAALRDRLKTASLHQTAFAKTIGRSPSWLNKYMNGDGSATIDDAVRIIALLIGLETAPLTALERRLLKSLAEVREDRREDAVAVWENAARGFPRAPLKESDGRAARTPAGKARKVRGTRKAAGE